MACSSKSMSSVSTEVFDENMLDTETSINTAWSENVDRQPDVIIQVNESDLIQNAQLTVSERDALRMSGSFRSSGENSTADDNSAGVPALEHMSPRCMDVVELEEDFDMFYSQEQVGENDLIQRAKLADDGLHMVKAEDQAAERRWNTLDLPRDNDDSGSDNTGYKTPMNSEVEAETNVVEIHVKQTSIQTAIPELTKAKTEERLLDILDNMPTDPDFTLLVANVVTKLDDCYLDDILSVFTGTWILESGLLTGLITTDQLIRLLRKHRFISRDNLYLLQNLVMRLDDTDLYVQAVQYIRHHHNIVQFYPELKHIPKGFGLVRCHVSGRDFTRLSREDIELVRFKLSSVLFLPVKHMYIVGIDLGQQVLVSCLLPERYVLELAEMVSCGVPDLRRVGIDAIQIHGKTYITVGSDERQYREEQEHVRFLSFYKQLREKNKYIEERDHEIKELREEAQFMQLELDTMSAELELLTQQALHESIGRRVLPRQPKRRRFRTRSLPLPSDEKLAETKKLAIFPRTTSNIAMKVKDSTNQPNAGYCPETPPIKVERLTDQRYKTFDETDGLMTEIQAILDELAVIQSC